MHAAERKEKRRLFEKEHASPPEGLPFQWLSRERVSLT